MEENQRGDSLLRAVVDWLATAGYSPIERHSAGAESFVVLHPPGAKPGAVQITHCPWQHCVRVQCAPSGHALHWYYHARRAADRDRLVAAIGAAVHTAW